MEALLRLVSLGSAARNSVKIKVRQPLSEMLVQTRVETEKQAIRRFHGQIEEELNIKLVRLHESGGPPLAGVTFRLNPKTACSKYRSDEPMVAADLGKVLSDLGSSGQIDLLVRTKLVSVNEYPITTDGLNELKMQEYVGLARPDLFSSLEPVDVLVMFSPWNGWSGVEDRGTIVCINKKITVDLAQEGMAREVVRHIQELRKQADLEMEDRIVLYLHTESAALRAAIEKHRDYIAAETLVKEWSNKPLDGEVHQTDVKVDGQALRIELQKFV